MKENDRVQIHIRDAATWAKGAAEALNGIPGTLVRRKSDGEWLVLFDWAAPRWGSQHMTPWRSGWFGEGDLEMILKDENKSESDDDKT